VMKDYRALIENIIVQAKNKGADEAEVFLEIERESQVTTRMGEIETLKEAIARGLGIRVFKDGRLGFVFSSDFNEEHLNKLAAKAVELAEYTTTDKFNGLPKNIDTGDSRDLQLYDPEIEKLEQTLKIDTCKNMEKQMFGYDKRITNSEGASFYDGNSEIFIANSNGLFKQVTSSYCYLMAMPVANQDGKLQTDYWFSISRHFNDLDSPENVAKKAAERAIRMLNGETVKTSRVPVVFDQLTGAAFLGNIRAAVNGDAVYKKSTFLVDKLNQKVGSDIVTIRDDALIPRAVASSPFDGEGIPTQNKAIIDHGRLMSYMYDTYTAGKAGTKSTGNAQRGYSSTPDIGGFNFYLEKGDNSPEEIIGSVDNGLYVTNIMGFGADMATGDYSQGASGLWIEKGKLTRPVEGITIALNILDMMNNIVMIGNDLEFMGPVSSPTFKISEMIVAGN